MNYLNSFLIKDKAASARAISIVNPRIKVWKVDAREPLLSVKAFGEILASSLLPKLTSVRFQYRLQ